MQPRLLTEREEELLRREHVLEIQAEGIFRDLYVSSTQRGLMRDCALWELVLAEAQLILFRIKDIDLELKQIAKSEREEAVAMNGPYPDNN